MAVDEKETTAVGSGVTISDNTKGNPYHAKGSGEFTSKEGGSGTETKTDSSPIKKKSSKFASIFTPTPDKVAAGKGRSKLSNIFGAGSSTEVNSLDAKYEQERKFLDNSPGIITLKNYLKNRDSRKEKVSKYRAVLRPEQLRAIQTKQRQIFKESNMCRAMPLGDIESFLKDGELLNLFSHLGYGSHSKDARAQASKNMFGADVNPADAYTTDPEKSKPFKALEKYGYLGDKKLKDVMKQNTASGYGGGGASGILIFDKDRMSHRTTYTIGDSLGGGYHNDLLPQLYTRGYDICCNTNSYNSPSEDEINNCKTAEQLKHALGEWSYIELQYHGKVTPQDVKGICIKESTILSGEARNVINKAKMAGLEIYTYNKLTDKAERLIVSESGDYSFQDINEEE